jgi:surface antigen
MSFTMPATCKSLAFPFTLALISFGFASSAMADNDHGKGHGNKHHGREHKEEFWDGNCKVERKWEKDGDYKEKRTCNAPHARSAAPVVVQPVTVVYPPWVVVEQGRPHHYRSGYEPVPVPTPVQQAQVSTQVSYCNSETVGQVLGGVAGALIGNQVGQGTGRTAATVGGAIAGVLVGGEVGRRMDARDQACIGQTLELAPAGRRVEWAQGSGKYAVVPGAVVHRGDTYCRPYQAQVHTPTGWQTTRGTACRRKDGVWVTTA